MNRRTLTAALSIFIFSGTAALADDFQAEVLKLEGTVTARDAEGAARPLKEGDLLKAGESLEADPKSYADLAYDSSWKNVTRLEESSKMKIASIAPGRIELDRGAVFAKMKQMPHDSSFEVKTPTAVATVRGSEYRTLFTNGRTEVVNAESSSVVVYGLLEDGSLDKDNAVRLQKHMKTHVPAPGTPPAPPAEISSEEKDAGLSLSSFIEQNVQEAETSGRIANIQSVDAIESFIREEKRKAVVKPAPKPSELSRVTDLRRRAFDGGEKEMAPDTKEQNA